MGGQATLKQKDSSDSSPDLTF